MTMAARMATTTTMKTMGGWYPTVPYADDPNLDYPIAMTMAAAAAKKKKKKKKKTATATIGAHVLEPRCDLPRPETAGRSNGALQVAARSCIVMAYTTVVYIQLWTVHIVMSI